MDIFGGHSMIVNHRGFIVAQQTGWTVGDSFVNTVIDMEALRKVRIANGLFNQFKDLRTEQYAAIYAQPIYPKNQYRKTAEKGWLAREARLRKEHSGTREAWGHRATGFCRVVTAAACLASA